MGLRPGSLSPRPLLSTRRVREMVIITVHLSRCALQKYTQENHIIHCPVLAFAQEKVVFSNQSNGKHQFQGQMKCLSPGFRMSHLISQPAAMSALTYTRPRAVLTSLLIGAFCVHTWFCFIRAAKKPVLSEISHHPAM